MKETQEALVEVRLLCELGCIITCMGKLTESPA
jgi:hypothetical protein